MPLGMVGQGGLAPLTPLVSVLVFSASHPCCFSLSCYLVYEAPIELSVRLLISCRGKYWTSKLLTLHYRACVCAKPIPKVDFSYQQGQ